MVEITDEIVRQTKEWLGEGGVAFFRKIKQDHGTLLAVLDDGGIPYPIHFREGMKVRNFLRGITNHSWTAHDYDNNWAAIVERCL